MKLWIYNFKKIINILSLSPFVYINKKQTNGSVLA
nr:hypothetical protein CJLB15_00037 [Campylobacter phage CJLB-15]